jgi:hypothetical protein
LNLSNFILSHLSISLFLAFSIVEVLYFEIVPARVILHCLLSPNNNVFITNRSFLVEYRPGHD